MNGCTVQGHLEIEFAAGTVKGGGVTTRNAVLLYHGYRNPLFGQIGPADQSAKAGADDHRGIIGFGTHLGSIRRNLAPIQGERSGRHG